MDPNPLKRIESLERRVSLLEQKGEAYGQAQTAEATQNAGAAASGTQGAGKEDPTASGDQGEAGGISGAD